MNIEQSIAELTAALKENTSALKDFLSVRDGIFFHEVRLADPVKHEEAMAQQKAVLTTLAAEPAKKRTKKTTTSEPAAPAVEQEEEGEAEVTDTPVVPELPIEDLRASLKETIKAKMFADPAAKDTFATARTKYGIKLVAELTDEQVPEFYKEVLSW